VNESCIPSPLEAEHRALGAKLVPFAGWNMPVQYTSILDEHAAVRERCGIFDISHMGQFLTGGPQAAAWLDRMLANRVAKLAPGEGQYTFLLNERGGVIDDLIVYRCGEESWFMVVNAAKIEEDFFWLLRHLPEGLELRNESDLWAGMAVQGPLAPQVFAKALPAAALPPRNGIARFATDDGGEAIVCRTGYTGEDGFEFFAPAARGAAWFRRFLEAGAQPCGLGARDSLRLEMCYPLNGSDLSPGRTPLEAGLGFFVDLDKGDFIGRDALLRQREQGLRERLAALQYSDKGAPPRAHYEVFSPDGDRLGELTSGVLSPSLRTGIGLAYLPADWAKPGSQVLIDVRGRRFPATVVKKPFYKPAKREA
jgi:aminomethyltransferase